LDSKTGKKKGRPCGKKKRIGKEGGRGHLRRYNRQIILPRKEGGHKKKSNTGREGY